jgi:hypothetical protein
MTRDKPVFEPVWDFAGCQAAFVSPFVLPKSKIIESGRWPRTRRREPWHESNEVRNAARGARSC